MRSRLLLFSSFITLVVFVGCTETVLYEKNKPVNCHGWDIGDTLVYTVDVADISSKYDLSLNVRHRDVYQYMNLYLTIVTILPSGEQKKEIVSIPLSDESGKWQGKCSGDICFQRVFLMRKLLFPEKGNYQFRIHHDMRVNKLENIFDIGVRLEKSIKPKYTQNENN